MKPRQGTQFKIGKVCEKHPELEGKRYANSCGCPGCVADRNRKPAVMEYKRNYQREYREDPAIREMYRQDRAKRRGPRKAYSAKEWQGLLNQIKFLEAKLSEYRARLAKYEGK